jgi:hypothetical protein
LEKKRMSAGKQAQRARLRTLAITAGFLAVVGVGYAIFPRHPDPRAFDPAAMARSETLMWRHYCERRYLSLVADLYVNSWTQYGFSPWESVSIAAAAARAALAFQPSTSRTGAQVALPFLEDYFGWPARRRCRLTSKWWLGPNSTGGRLAERTSLQSDARDGAITEADWSAIELRLTEAYEILKREVSNGPPGT